MQKQANRIFIIGHSGAGKGVLAQAIAKKLDWKFIDSDFSLEPSIGQSMTKTLSEPGKHAFQQTLSHILNYQTSLENIVVTTDDSIIELPENQAILKTEFSVFLQVSLPVQLERIGHNRPLLANHQYSEFLTDLRKQRDHLYNMVQSHTLSSDDGDIDQHVKSTIDAFNNK
ncbi:hypothetical protein L3V82_07210 [Thiotrichales bacterium 19S3-7]|nr:hypothetical protein [Thiotrichales bacterium 19S3-7]MCF6801945.1 hypothetical protein [Thiotrichales bacterium 19S3-11]